MKDSGPLITLLCTIVGTGVAVIIIVVMIGANINNRLDAIVARLDAAQIEENRRFDAINARLDEILEVQRDHEGRILRLEERANPTDTE